SLCLVGYPHEKLFAHGVLEAWELYLITLFGAKQRIQGAECCSRISRHSSHGVRTNSVLLLAEAGIIPGAQGVAEFFGDPSHERLDGEVSMCRDLLAEVMKMRGLGPVGSHVPLGQECGAPAYVLVESGVSRRAVGVVPLAEGADDPCASSERVGLSSLGGEVSVHVDWVRALAEEDPSGGK